MVKTTVFVAAVSLVCLMLSSAKLGSAGVGRASLERGGDSSTGQVGAARHRRDRAPDPVSGA